MKFLVVPSNRPDRLAEFFSAWKGRGGWDKVVVVEDRPERSDLSQAAFDDIDFHYSWKEIDSILGDDSCIISREDSAIRSFGFLAAWHLGATSILTLDDDCYPGGAYDLFAAHLNAMNSHPVWVPSVPGQRTRGIPYQNLESLGNVMVNVGLWSGVGDWDSIQDVPPGRFNPPLGSRIVSHGQLIPMCGMNLCFKRPALPLMYFPPMGRGQPYRRFDDIWCGVIVKFLMDRLDWRMSVGYPFVEHIRASDPAVNRVKEAPGIKANETFWWTIKRAVDSIDVEDTLTAVSSLGAVLSVDGDRYIRNLGSSLIRWSRLLDSMELRF